MMNKKLNKELTKNNETLKNIKIPLPPKDIQEKIVSEIEVLEKKEQEKKEKVEILKSVIEKIVWWIEWEKVILSNYLQEIDWNSTKIKKSDITTKWKYPVITQERENFISWYSDNENIITDLPLILFWDHSCTFKYIDFPFLRWADWIVLLKIKSEFDTKFLYYVIKNIEIENSGKYERHFKYLKNIKIPLPSFETQKKIVSQIEKIESEIGVLENDLKSIPDKKAEVLKKYL